MEELLTFCRFTFSRSICFSLVIWMNDWACLARGESSGTQRVTTIICMEDTLIERNSREIQLTLNDSCRGESSFLQARSISSRENT